MRVFVLAILVISSLISYTSANATEGCTVYYITHTYHSTITNPENENCYYICSHQNYANCRTYDVPECGEDCEVVICYYARSRKDIVYYCYPEKDYNPNFGFPACGAVVERLDPGGTTLFPYHDHSYCYTGPPLACNCGFVGLNCLECQLPEYIQDYMADWMFNGTSVPMSGWFKFECKCDEEGCACHKVYI